MKYIILFILFSLSVSAQETVGITTLKSDPFVSYNGSVKTGIKIFRLTALTTSLDVTYTVSGSTNTDISSGTTTIPANSQVSEIEINATAAPGTDETLTVTVTDVANPDYDLEGRNSVAIEVTAAEPTPAFTSAEGAGKYVGSEVNGNTWRGKDVYFVTNCNLSGAGSFQGEITSANTAGGGYIIFRVDCELEVTTRFVGAYSGIYIAGQTAPGDGILISGYSATNGAATFNDGDNMLIRYINFVHGDRLTGGSIDAVGFYNSDQMYLNHCSIFRGDDELASAATTDNTDWTGSITFDYNFFGEAYWDIGVKNHNTATIMGGLSGNSTQNQIFTGNFSWNKNLTYNVSHRFPNYSGSIHGESVNNVIGNHNNRIMQVSYPQPKINWVGNYIKPGNETDDIGNSPFTTSNPFLAGNAMSTHDGETQDDGGYTFASDQSGLIYADGNVIDGYFTEGEDDWALNYMYDFTWNGSSWVFSSELYDPYSTSYKISKTDIYGTTEYLTASQAYTLVTGAGGAGASKRLEEDGSVTNRYNTWYQDRIDDVVAGTMPAYIDVDAWAADRPTWSSSTTPYTDTDSDGMGDAWETANGLNVGVDDHAGHDLHATYDNIEVFLNLVDEAPFETNAIKASKIRLGTGAGGAYLGTTKIKG